MFQNKWTRFNFIHPEVCLPILELTSWSACLFLGLRCYSLPSVLLPHLTTTTSHIKKSRANQCKDWYSVWCVYLRGNNCMCVGLFLSVCVKPREYIEFDCVCVGKWPVHVEQIRVVPHSRWTVADQHIGGETGNRQEWWFSTSSVVLPLEAQVITSLSLGHPDNMAVHKAFFVLHTHMCKGVFILQECMHSYLPSCTKAHARGQHCPARPLKVDTRKSSLRF